MNKKTRYSLTAVIIITFLLLAIGAIIYFFSAQQASVSGTCSGGSTILSISNAVVTTSQDLGGKSVVRVTAVANGGGECARIQFSASDIENKLKANGQNYEVDNNVYGNLDTISQTETFTATQTTNTIYEVAKDDIGTFVWCSKENCEAKHPNTISASRIFVGYPCVCVYKYPVGREANFDDTLKKDFDVAFSIDGLGEVHLSSATQSAKLGSQAFIKWSGDLFAGTWLSKPTNYDAYFQISDNKYRMVANNFYSDISSRLIKDSQTAYGETGCLQASTSLDTCIAQYNAFVDLKTANKEGEYWMRESSVSSLQAWNGNKLAVNLETDTTWQMFTIDLDASFVGIHKNTGIPEVTCPSGREDVVSGRELTSTFNVRDKAGTNPSFGLSLTCNSGSGTVQSSRISNVGTTNQQVKGYVTIDTTTEKDFSCTFEAYDLNDPAQKDTCVANYRAKPFKGCMAGTEKACSSDGKQFGTCNSAGTDFTWVDCQYGCEAFENTYRCRLQKEEICDNGIDDNDNGLIDDKDPDCKVEVCGKWFWIFPDIPCLINQWLTKFKIVFAIVFGFLGGLFASLFSNKFMEKKELAKKWWILGLIFLIVGAGIGYLAYSYFWFAISIIILIIIINVIISKINPLD